MDHVVWPASFWVTWVTVMLCIMAAMMVGAVIVEWWKYTADQAAKVYLCNGLVGVSVAVLLVLLLSVRAPAHNIEHPEFDDWFATLKQPDNPDYSCCGIADAYWCDDVFVKSGSTFCRITDDRDDLKLKNRTHVPVGTVIEIPDTKLKWDRGNPTGHAVVFLTGYGAVNGLVGAVLCFVQGTGI